MNGGRNKQTKGGIKMDFKELIKMAFQFQTILKNGWVLNEQDGTFFLSNDSTGDYLIIRSNNHFLEMIHDFNSYYDKVYLEMEEEGLFD